MVAARLGFEKPMVGTGRATLRPDCMDRLRKYVHVPLRMPYKHTYIQAQPQTKAPLALAAPY